MDTADVPTSTDTTNPPTAPVTPVIEAPLPTVESPQNRSPWRRSLLRLTLSGVISYLATAALSFVLAAVLIFAALSAISAMLGGTQLGSATTTGGGQGISPSDAEATVRALFAFVGYTFFASHFTPIEASGLGGATYSLVGLGSVTIAAVAILLPFAFSRRMERLVPMPSTTAATIRGFLIAIPYAVGSIALYFPSLQSVGPDQLGVSFHPSGLGLVLPGLLAGVGGAMGAASVRSVGNPFGSAVVRGVARATVGIVIGLIATAVVIGIWLAVGSLTQPSGSPAPQPAGVTLSPAERNLGWSLVALIPFYFGNALGLAWTATLGGDLFGTSAWHPFVYIGPLLGAIFGALQLRRQPDRIEQASYAAMFAILTFLIAITTTPSIINGPALLQNTGTAVVVAFVIAVAAALLAPYLLTLAPVAVIATRPPVNWIAKPLLSLWPGEASHLEFLPGAGQMALPIIRLGRAQMIVAGSVVALIVVGVVGNAQLVSRFSPQSAAVGYLQAESRADAEAMWSMVTFEGQSATSSSLLSKDALKAMLRYSANTNLSSVRVTDSNRQDDSNYIITMSVTRNGQPTTMRVHVRRDQSRSNWLLYPFWRVVIQPSSVQVTSFPHAGAITVDGFTSGISGSDGSFEVIPGQHEVDLAPTSIFAGDAQVIDASNDTTVQFKATLTGQATTAVDQAISGLFVRCAGAQLVSPTNCPNSSYALGDRQSNVKWTLIGDPTTSMQLNIADQADTITASGDWKMHLSYSYWYDFDSSYVQHWEEDVSGYFDDTLHWNGSGFDITAQSGY